MAEENPHAQIAINGFIASILIVICSVVYVLWAVLPDEVLHAMHLTYYPDRYWAVALPAILVMFFFHYFTTSWILVLITTNPLTDGRCITDVDNKPDNELEVGALADSSNSVPPWVDIPVSVASNLLFEPWKEKVRVLLAFYDSVFRAAFPLSACFNRYMRLKKVEEINSASCVSLYYCAELGTVVARCIAPRELAKVLNWFLWQCMSGLRRSRSGEAIPASHPANRWDSTEMTGSSAA